jgi:virginiamycin B lyase
VGIASDGAGLWFVEIAAGQLGRISVSGEIEEWALPDRACRPHAIVATGVGECWFSNWGSNRVGHRTRSGEIVELELPSPGSEPHGITVGPDGAIWVAQETGSVARIDPT